MTTNLDSAANVSVSGLSDIRTSLDGINISAEKVSRSLTQVFSRAIVGGKSFDQTLRSVGQSLSRIALKSGIQPLLQGASGLVNSTLGSLAGAGGSGASITPFAEGGIVSRPTFFGAGGGVGLMGERGAEAIIPLSRGPDGKLGLSGSAARGQPPTVNITINTPDIENFRRSQVQVTSAIARAVLRGRRGL